jgi:tartrate-resistant acid phosphatase type 5
MKRPVILCLLSCVAFCVRLSAAESPTRFALIGDYGDDGKHQAAVAEQVNMREPDFIVTTGDNTYLMGHTSAEDFANWDRTQGKYYGRYIKLPERSVYGPGSAANRFFPVLGNHDFDEGVESYSDYFDLPANVTPTSGERYYRFTRGPVEVFMLSSDPHEPDGNEVGSVQYLWAQDAIRSSKASWQIVVFHHPAYTFANSGHEPSKNMRWPFQSWGVDAVFSGHVHNMQDLTVNDPPSGNPSLPYFVQGAGGHKKRYAITGKPESATGLWSNADVHGFCMIEASVDKLIVSFHDVQGDALHRRELVTTAPQETTAPSATTQPAPTSAPTRAAPRELDTAR